MTPNSHLVLFPFEAWGHARPLCVLASRIVKSKPCYITFFTTSQLADRVHAELSRDLGPAEAHLLKMIRVVALSKLNTGVIAEDAKALYASFADAYQKLVQEEPVTCSHSDAQFDSIGSPDVAILDFFCLPPLDSVRQLSIKPVKALVFYPGSASFILHPAGPEDKGGKGDLRPEIMQEVAKSQREVTEVADEIMLRVDGSVINIPGLPPMYDYEHHPQEMLLTGVVGIMWMMLYEIMQKCDGVIVTSPEFYEPESIAAIKDWFAQTSRSVYVIGPLLPIGEHAIAGEVRQSASATEIENFMESVLKSHGPKSLLYISFGSLFWMRQEEKIWTFLDVVMEKKIPFIMSHASPFANVPEKVKEKVKAYGLGLLSPWSPQQTILSHPVTGWFLTHGGQNSVLEAICSGVPIICWPYHADQPLNAVHLTHNLDVGYELLEVRTGHGLKVLHRIGKAPLGTDEALREEASTILDNAFGSDGEKKRTNMKKLQDTALGSWSEDGPAQKGLDAFLNSVTV